MEIDSDPKGDAVNSFDLRSQMAYIAAYDMKELETRSHEQLLMWAGAVIDRANRALAAVPANNGVMPTIEDCHKMAAQVGMRFVPYTITGTTMEDKHRPVGWETEAEWALEQRAFQWNGAWSEEDTRELINDLWRQYCLAAEPKEHPKPSMWFVKDFADGWIAFDNEADAKREVDATGAMMMLAYQFPPVIRSEDSASLAAIAGMTDEED